MPLALGVPGIGPLLIVLAVVIIVLGPKRLPALARQLGSGIKELRKSVGGDDDDEQIAPGEPTRRDARADDAAPIERADAPRRTDAPRQPPRD